MYKCVHVMLTHNNKCKGVHECVPLIWLDILCLSNISLLGISLLVREVLLLVPLSQEL